MAAWPDAAARRQAIDIVRELAVSDFRLKYFNSLLGYGWSMLSPLLMLGAYYFVFRFVLGAASPGYLAYLLVGLVYWTFFQDCTFSGMTALAGKAALLKCVRVPVVLVVVAAALSTIITVAINTAVLVAALAILGRLSPLAPLALLPAACLVALATGVGCLVALAHVRFRDTGLIWNVLLQAWFWMTPVVYAAPSGRLGEFLFLNPLARCLFLIRWFLLYDYLPPLRFTLVTVVMCVAVLASGLTLLVRRQRLIPEAR
jgi:ABC-type polysaccharide/polyol phosphate export permease